MAPRSQHLQYPWSRCECHRDRASLWYSAFLGVLFSVFNCKCVPDLQILNGSYVWLENSGGHSCNSRCHVHERSDSLVKAFVDVRGSPCGLRLFCPPVFQTQGELPPRLFSPLPWSSGVHLWAMFISESMSRGVFLSWWPIFVDLLHDDKHSKGEWVVAGFAVLWYASGVRFRDVSWPVHSPFDPVEHPRQPSQWRVRQPTERDIVQASGPVAFFLTLLKASRNCCIVMSVMLCSCCTYMFCAL